MPKKPVGLVICDIDNTISETFNIWGGALDAAIDALAALHKTDRPAMEDILLKAVPENRKGTSGPLIGINLAADIARTEALHGKTPQEKAFFTKEHARIVHNWQKERDKAVLYDGVLPTIRKIKAAGAKFVLFTDARESACLPRLAKMGFPPELIDRIYVQPDIEKMPTTPFTVKNSMTAFKEAVAGKIVRLPPKSPKPNRANMCMILEDMGVKDPSAVVMVGDNIRSDGGCAGSVGAAFAWQKKGTEVTEQTARCYAKFAANPEYKIGTQAHLAQMNESNRPTVVLQNGFADLDRHFRFVAPEKAAANGSEKPAFPLLKKLRTKAAGR
ncbi:MAG: HAD family hydrolase [Alphaproteobacteria bacterium]|jgi:phosphoglycolate phosphatase-like HAD superfamily hydrolase